MFHSYSRIYTTLKKKDTSMGKYKSVQSTLKNEKLVANGYYGIT